MKKLLALLLILTLEISATALTLDNTEDAKDVSTAFLAEESNVGKPGYNLWTGTTEAYTFDGDLLLTDSSTLGDINKDWATDTEVFIKDDNGNKVINISGDRKRFSVNSPFSIDATRPVTLSFKFKTAATSSMYMSVRANKSGFWLNGTSPYIWESSAYQVNLNYNPNNWVKQSKVITPADARNLTHETAPTTVTSFWFQLASYYSTPVYIDDVSFIPHYKITYDLAGATGTVPEDEYFLNDGYVLKADTSSFSTPDNAIFSHWVDQFGRKFTTTVTPMLGEDLILTASFYIDHTNEPGYNLLTGTTEPYTFDGNPVLSDTSTTGDINKAWASDSDVYIANDSGNASLHLKGDRSHFSINAPISVEATRPVTMSYKFKSTASGAMYMSVRANKHGYWLNGTSPFIWESAAYQVNLNYNVNNWVVQNKVILPADARHITHDAVPTTVTSFWFQLAAYYTTPVYIDDVSFIPHYKITYDLGEGSGETPADEYFLADEYTLTADPSSISAPKHKEFSHWVDQFGNEFTTTVTPVLGEDLILTAVFEDIDYTKQSPGINLWTGTTEPYNFEGDLILTNGATGDINKNFANDTDVFIADDNGNNVMHLKGDRSNFSVNAVFSIDADRPVTLTYQFKTAATTQMWMTVRTNNKGWWHTVGGNTYIWESGAYKVDLSNGNTNKWSPQTKTFLPKDGIDASKDTVPTFAERFWFQLASYYSTPVYIDDVSFIPHYKVTYNLGEGSGETPEDEYFLADKYTLKADIEKIIPPSDKIFVCWMDQNGNKFYNNTITPTLGEDIALTAIYENPAPVMTQKVEIKGTGVNNGIRFKSEIKPSVKSGLDEFGFLATREVFLPKLDAQAGTYDYTALTFNLKSNETNYFVNGVAYDADGVHDAINSSTEDGSIVYTAVIYDIPLTHKNEKMVVRSYAKFTLKEEEFTVYGNTAVASLYETAASIKDANGEAYVNNMEYIEKILTE